MKIASVVINVIAGFILNVPVYLKMNSFCILVPTYLGLVATVKRILVTTAILAPIINLKLALLYVTILFIMSVLASLRQTKYYTFLTLTSGSVRPVILKFSHFMK